MDRRKQFLGMLLLAGAAFSFFSGGAHAEPAETLPEKPVIKQFGNWSTRCEQYAGKPDSKRCHAFVDVRVGDRKERILYMGIGYMPDAAPGTIFIFTVSPLGSVLPQGIEIVVDGTTKITAPFLFCAPIGCQAEAVLTPDQLAVLKKGQELEIIFNLVEQGEVRVPTKLEGLDKALASLPKNAPARPSTKIAK